MAKFTLDTPVPKPIDYFEIEIGWIDSHNDYIRSLIVLPTQPVLVDNTFIKNEYFNKDLSNTVSVHILDRSILYKDMYLVNGDEIWNPDLIVDNPNFICNVSVFRASLIDIITEHFILNPLTEEDLTKVIDTLKQALHPDIKIKLNKK